MGPGNYPKKTCASSLRSEHPDGSLQAQWIVESRYFQCHERTPPGCQRSTSRNHFQLPGQQLSQVLEHIEESTKDDLVSLSGKQGMKLDIPQIPELLIDNTDRNRTSPFAFTETVLSSVP